MKILAGAQNKLDARTPYPTTVLAFIKYSLNIYINITATISPSGSFRDDITHDAHNICNIPITIIIMIFMDGGIIQRKMAEIFSNISQCRCDVLYIDDKKPQF